MPEIGIRELKTRISQVVRAVKEHRARYVIRVRGKPVALLIPADAEPPSPRADDVWARLERLGKEVAERWASDKSAVEVLSEMRR
jgi:prevent-host-death family protein